MTMSDDLPVGSHGGIAIQHRFPVDGEYEIQVDLQRGRAQEIWGTGRERKLDLRFDDQSLLSCSPLRRRVVGGRT
jgi:hypothetical protein